VGTYSDRRVPSSGLADRLTFVFSASPGGTLGRYFTGVVRALDGRGHRVTLLAPPSYAETRVDDVGDAQVVAWTPAEAGRRAAFRLVDDLLRRQPVDATVSSFSGDNVLQTVARRRRVPARLAWHHTPSTQLRLDGAVGLRWGYQRRRKALVYRQCTDLLVATEYVARDIQEQFGVAPDKVIREPYAMPDPGPQATTPVPGRVLFVGRFYPSKGHDWFLRSLPAVAAEVPELALRLTGVGGPEEARIRGLVDELGLRERCTWLGHVSREELFEELAAASLSVVPSRAEGFGLVTIEAEAVGTPVVASDIPPSRVTVADGESGVLVPLDDEAAMAEALIRVLTDTELRGRLSAGARRHFVDNFDLGRRSEAIADRYEELARRRLE
jgi:glycosyltransferase involved in cell wall biosynthesis